ncbi:MAG TPA: Gfo/Idh/MocA family oxidoreductase [Candidatus Methylacidiphilales bacterium]|nr:Gfo/Idh/MocA family oxidoreductase [Candidatus Methylacidiphilales bacterium]
MHKTPVFGVIGTGFIGRIHLKALQAAGLTVGALAEPSRDALAAAAPLAPDARHYSDWSELLADPEITAVNICTINALHYSILKAAIASGKHVFCEKTMTTNAVEAREALAISLAPGQVVQIGYMKRFFPASVWAKEQLSRIGTPICATVRSFQGGLVDEKIYDSADWRPVNGEPSRTRRFASGGMLNMAGSHMLDMTAWLLGDPKNVSCRTWSPEGYDAELHAHGLFEMSSGTIVHFEAALPHLSKTGEFMNGWEELIQINGTKGRLEIVYPLWDRPADFAARARVYIEETKSWEEPVFPAADAFRLELEAFAASCRNRAATTPSVREGAVVDCWIDACYASAKSGSTETVNLGNTTP